MIKHFLNPPNWFTSASIFCSIYALTSVLGAEEVTAQVLSRACVLVIFGGIFDLLDGRVARLTNRYSAFGVQLDSIADIIGFGVAPALICWEWAVKDLGATGVAITFWYVLCASFRLARFNVAAQEQDHNWPLPGHTQGLTSTMSGGILVTFVWVCNDYLAVLQPPGWLVGLVVALLGGMMISSLPFRNFKDLRRSKITRRYFALLLGSCLTAAIVFDISMWWAVGAVLYLAIGIGDGLVVAWWHRKLSKALMLDLDDLEEFFGEGFTEDEDY